MSLILQLPRNDKSEAGTLFWVLMTSSLEELPQHIRYYIVEFKECVVESEKSQLWM